MEWKIWLLLIFFDFCLIVLESSILMSEDFAHLYFLSENSELFFFLIVYFDKFIPSLFFFMPDKLIYVSHLLLFFLSWLLFLECPLLLEAIGVFLILFFNFPFPETDTFFLFVPFLGQDLWEKNLWFVIVELFGICSWYQYRSIYTAITLLFDG